MKNPIPQNILEAAKADFSSQIVQEYIAEACRAAGGDPSSGPEHYPPAADDVYATLRNASHFASIGEPGRDPYPSPETSFVWALLTEAQQAEVKTLPAWQQREAARAFCKA